MKKLFALLLLVFSLTMIGAKAQNRIISGQNTYIINRPFQACVLCELSDGTHKYGGGVIIDHQWILTAAHLVDNLTANQISVVVGQTDVQHNLSQALSIDQVYIHENFVPDPVLAHDIALLHLAEPLTYTSSIKPIHITQEREYPAGTNCIVTGWGVHNVQGNSTMDNLAQLQMACVTIQSCSSTKITVVPSSSCVYRGDSGGPLTVGGGKNLHLIGIVSSADEDSPQSNATYFTNVAFYRNWIFNKMGITGNSISGPDLIDTNSQETYSFSAVDADTEISSNFSIVYRSNTEVCVSASQCGPGYIKLCNTRGPEITKNIWCGKPIVTGINYNGRTLRAVPDVEACVDMVSWTLEGTTIITDNPTTYRPIGHTSGIKYVTVRTHNAYGWSAPYSDDIIFSSSRLSVTRQDRNIYISLIDNNNDTIVDSQGETASYTLTNIITGQPVKRGIMSVNGEIIDCTELESGLYNLIVVFDDNVYEQKITLQ